MREEDRRLNGPDERVVDARAVVRTESAPATRRQKWVRALPHLAAGLGTFFLLVPEKNFLERILMSVVWGGFLPVGGMLLGVFVEHTIRKMATGQEPRESVLIADKEMMAVVLLLFVLVWFLGTYWRVSERERIAQCLKEIELGTLNRMEIGIGNSVSWYCTESYKLERVESSPDY